MYDSAKFKQVRFIEWIKTNPQPRNSNVNYLTNCREVAVSAVKGGKPTFNSKYDKGIYEYPLYTGKDRFQSCKSFFKKSFINLTTTEFSIVQLACDGGRT